MRLRGPRHCFGTAPDRCVPWRSLATTRINDREGSCMTVVSWRARSIIALAVAIGFASVSYADHSWGGFHWARTSNPFTLKVGDNVSSAWDPFLDGAISDWNTSIVLELTKVAGNTRPRQCKPTPGQLEVCNERYGNTGWLGVAQIWLNGD